MYKLFLAVVSVVCFQCASQKAEVRAPVDPCQILAADLEKSLVEMKQSAEQVMSENPGLTVKVTLGRQLCIGVALRAEIVMQISQGGKVAGRAILVQIDLLQDGSTKRSVIGEREERPQMQVFQD